MHAIVERRLRLQKLLENGKYFVWDGSESSKHILPFRFLLFVGSTREKMQVKWTWQKSRNELRMRQAKVNINLKLECNQWGRQK